MISHTHRFIFVHAGRTGGSTFERLAGAPLTSDEQTRQTGNTDFPEKHCDFQYYKDHYPEMFGPYFKFTLVRNPYDRLVSAWKWQTEVAKVIAPVTLAEFIRTRPESHSYAAKFRLDGLTVEDSVRKFDYIGRFENLSQSLTELFSILHIPAAEIPHTNSTRKADYRDFYDEESKLLLWSRYGTDLELFGYSF